MTEYNIAYIASPYKLHNIRPLEGRCRHELITLNVIG